MPAWNALYQIRDFGYHVLGLHASDAAGKPLPVSRSDKQTWRFEGQGEMRVEYADYWDEPGPFGTQLNDEHAFLNLAMVLCYVPERRAEETVVHFSDVPQGGASPSNCQRRDGAGTRLPRGQATTRWWTRRSRSGRSTCSQFQAARTADPRRDSRRPRGPRAR